MVTYTCFRHCNKLLACAQQIRRQSIYDGGHVCLSFKCSQLDQNKLNLKAIIQFGQFILGKSIFETGSPICVFLKQNKSNTFSPIDPKIR